MKAIAKKALAVASAVVVACSMLLATVPTTAKAADGVAMYRLYNSFTGEHLYTNNYWECSSCVSGGWNYEGIGWYAPSYSSTPVYRLYNRFAPGGEHHYTMDTKEVANLVNAGWSNEGIKFYSDDAQTVGLYREYNPNAFSNNHNYTTDANEHNSLLGKGWNNEGICWYGVATGKTVNRDDLRNAAVSAARSQSGVSYGTTVDGIYFDCSGFTLYAWYKAGFDFLPHNSHSQYELVQKGGRLKTNISELKPGDLVFYKQGGSSRVNHVALYVGNGRVIHSVQRGDTVRETSLSYVKGFCGGGSPV